MISRGRFYRFTILVCENIKKVNVEANKKYFIFAKIIKINNMKKLILLSLLSTQILVGFGQTIIQGMINSNVTLTQYESPYWVVGDLVVFPNWKLTIEPGVELRFEDNVKLQIRGTLDAKGTEAEPIFFISKTGNDIDSWLGIEIMNTLGGNATFDYCNFSHAFTAISEHCCYGGKVVVTNSRFTFNRLALGGYSGNAALVENCYFSDNWACIGNADKMINNCVFENNTFGLWDTERVSVSNSTFTNHSQVALYGGRGTLKNCVVNENNIGVRFNWGGFSIDDCDISNNQTGLELNADGSSWSVAPVNNSTICNNILYNVINNCICDVDLYNVCWCNDDSTTVENLIYDAYNDLYVGFVNYTLFSEDCSQTIFRTHKAEGYTEYLSIDNLTNNETDIFPNPAYSSLFIRSTEKINNVIIYDYTGKIVFDQFGFDNDLIELNVSEFSAGLYIVRLVDNRNKTEFKKVLIVK